MSALDLLSPKNKVGIGGQAGSVERTFGEIYSLSAYTTFLNTPVSGQFAEVGSVLNSRNKMIEDRTGKKISELTGTNLKYTNPTMEGRVNQAKEDNELLENIIEQGRKENSSLWSDIKTKQEIEGEAAKKVAFAEQETAYVKAGNPNVISRETAAFLGMTAGTMLDAPNVATLPISAPSAFVKTAGYGVAKTMLMNAAAEGVIQSGIQAAQIPDMKRWQETLGKEYGLSNAALDVGSAFAGGAILRGAGEAIGFGFRKALKQPDVTPSSYVLGEMARFIDPKRQVEKDALLYLSRTAYIDENAPFKVSNNTELAAHRDTVQKIVDDVEEYKRPAVEDVRVRERVAAENPVVRDVVDDGVVDGGGRLNDGVAAVNVVRVFHGTKEKQMFDKFSTDRIGKENGILKGAGVYFTNESGRAEFYAGSEGRILQAEIPEEKYFMNSEISILKQTPEVKKILDPIARDIFENGNTPFSKKVNTVWNSVDEMTGDDVYALLGFKLTGKEGVEADIAASRYLRKKGLVGSVVKDREGADEYLVYDPEDTKILPDFDTNAYSAKEYRETPLAPPEQIKQSERMESMKSSFDEMLEADPDMMIDIDANTRMKLSDYAKMVQEDEDILNAITTCRLQ